MDRTPTPTALLLALLLAAACPAQGGWVETPPSLPAGAQSVFVHDVAATDPANAWAVGHYALLTQPPYGTETFSLALHWNGNAWTQQPTPSPSPYAGGTNVRLHAVEAVAPDDVWAGGEARGNAGGLSLGAWIHVQHFDGSSWSEVTPPQPPGGVSINFSGTRIHAIEAVAADDVWFGGQWGEPNAVASVDWRPLAMHWDGSSLNLHATPVVWEGGYGFASVSISALATDDVWACCKKNTAGGHSTMNVILHWDGSQWSRVPAPTSSEMHVLHAIEAVAPNDVWAFGEVQWTGAPYVLHWDGSAWTEVLGAPTARAALALGPNELHAAGATLSRFDGNGWSTVASFPQVTNPILRGMAVDGAGGLWAVGTKAAPGVTPFILRRAPGAAASATVRSACFFPAPGNSLQALTPPVIGQSLVLRSGDPQDLAGLTPAGTQSWLFACAAPVATYPCGAPVPGFGIGSGFGELLVDVGPSSLLLIDGPVPWGGAGPGSDHTLLIPAIGSLAGLSLHLQAVLIDPVGPAAPGIVTDALELHLGY